MKKDQRGLTTGKVVKTVATGAAIAGAAYAAKKLKENPELRKQVASVAKNVIASIFKGLIG